MVNKISRRSFNKCVLGGALLVCTGAPTLTVQRQISDQDALLHIARDGELHIYSGLAHLGQHGSEDAVLPVCDILSAKRYRLMSGASPRHLPTMLGQYQTGLCFTRARTNKKAAGILKSFLSVAVRSGAYIEDGVSPSTRSLASLLDPKGLTIAVKA